MKKLHLEMDYYSYKKQGIRTAIVLISVCVLYFLLDLALRYTISKGTSDIEFLQVCYSLFLISVLIIGIGLTIIAIQLIIKMMKLLFSKSESYFIFSTEDCSLLSPLMFKEIKFNCNEIDKLKLELKGTMVTLYLDVKRKNKISNVLLGKKKYSAYLTLKSYQELKDFLVKKNTGIPLIIKENGKEVFKVAS